MRAKGSSTSPPGAAARPRRHRRDGDRRARRPHRAPRAGAPSRCSRRGAAWSARPSRSPSAARQAARPRHRAARRQVLVQKRGDWWPTWCRGSPPTRARCCSARSRSGRASTCRARRATSSSSTASRSRVPTTRWWPRARRLAEDDGGNGFIAVSVPRAALLLAQGVGRLIRSSTDRGVVAVLDPRLATARYGDVPAPLAAAVLVHHRRRPRAARPHPPRRARRPAPNPAQKKRPRPPSPGRRPEPPQPD